MSNKKLTIVLLITLVIAIIGLFTPFIRNSVGTISKTDVDATNYTKVTASDGMRIYAGGMYIDAGGLTLVSGALSAVAATFSGLFTTDAGHLKSYVNATSTADTTQTLALADINMYDRILMTPTVGATTITYPASSTLATFLPTAGDSMTQCWINATSTASKTLVFAAGTGWDFDIAATSTVLTGTNETTASYAVPALGIACAEYTRMPATSSTFDIKAAWTFYMKD
jgi:hypothetical protein